MIYLMGTQIEKEESRENLNDLVNLQQEYHKPFPILQLCLTKHENTFIQRNTN